MGYQTAIGLEIHIQLRTRTKAFCSCSSRFGDPANTNVCAVCLGYPGALPVLNRKAVEQGLRLALALGSRIEKRSAFARKSYFYPDLPKGYQITQLAQPLARGGRLPVPLADGGSLDIELERLHLEEDSARLYHPPEPAVSLVDFNRSGVPLVELVTRPVISEPVVAGAFLRQLRRLVRWLEVSDGNMEEGSLRCDANISLAPAASDRLGTKSEIKNLNSFRHVERALEHEQKRHRQVLAAGGRLAQETRLWDEKAALTRTMRTKERAHDYRYFREPDLGTLELDRAGLDRLRRQLPELPWQRSRRLVSTHGLTEHEAALITQDQHLADYYEHAVAAYSAQPRMTAAWLLNQLLGERSCDRSLPITAAQLGELIALIDAGRITGTAAKQVLLEMRASGRSAETIVNQLGLSTLRDDEQVRALVGQVLAEHPEQVADYAGGRSKLLGFFVGQVMRASGGCADPEQVTVMLRDALGGGGDS